MTRLCTHLLLAKYEITSALTRTRGELREEDAEEALEIIGELGIVYPSPVDQARIIEIAADLERHSAYHAAYLALAEQLGAEVWTLNWSFARNAASRYRVELID